MNESYRSKSTAELLYICKDAGEAAVAMRGLNAMAENKYLDQVNDACTELHLRKTCIEYNVTMRFAFPAWDEKDGITYVVFASSKAQACKRARRIADDDGHSGRRFFTAVEAL